MSRRRDKKIKAKEANGGPRIKSPSSGSQHDSTQNTTPLFCFCGLTGNYCLSKCNGEQKSAFADTIHKLSKLTWAQIATADRHGSGHEKIARGSLRGVTIPADLTEDVDILAFRFCGMMPMLGYRLGRVFHVIALDRNHVAY